MGVVRGHDPGMCCVNQDVRFYLAPDANIVRDNVQSDYRSNRPRLITKTFRQCSCSGLTRDWKGKMGPSRRMSSGIRC